MSIQWSATNIWPLVGALVTADSGGKVHAKPLANSHHLDSALAFCAARGPIGLGHDFAIGVVNVELIGANGQVSLAGIAIGKRGGSGLPRDVARGRGARRIENGDEKTFRVAVAVAVHRRDGW